MDLSTAATSSSLKINKNSSCADDVCQGENHHSNNKNKSSSFVGDAGGGVAILKLVGSHGLGSQILNLFKSKMYLEEKYNRTVILLDETDWLPYRKSDAVGVLTGYFTPQLPILDNPSRDQLLLQQQRIQQQLTTFYFGDDDGASSSLNNTSAATMTNNINISESQREDDALVWVWWWWLCRSEVKKYYKKLPPTVLCDRLAREICPHLQFNDYTKQEMQQLKAQHGLHFDAVVAVNNSSFSSSKSQERTTNANGGRRRPSSVAFHVRRADKLDKESRLFTGIEYVRQLKRMLVMQEPKQQSSANSNNTATITVLDYCYVSTDDILAVKEVQQALIEHNISCPVHSLVDGRFGIQGCAQHPVGHDHIVD